MMPTHLNFPNILKIPTISITQCKLKFIIVLKILFPKEQQIDKTKKVFSAHAINTSNTLVNNKCNVDGELAIFKCSKIRQHATIKISNIFTDEKHVIVFFTRYY